MTYTRAGLRCRPPPQSLAEKREKPPRTDGAYPRGPDSGVGGDRRGEERGSDWKWRDWAECEWTRGHLGPGKRPKGRAERARAAASAEFVELREVTQTLRACFLFSKKATVVEPTSWALLVVLGRELMQLS